MPQRSFSPVQDHLRMLDRDAAAATGHIAWIEDTDPVRAMRRMFNAVSQKPYNAAVWANAIETADPAMRASIASWRNTETLVYSTAQNWQRADLRDTVNARETTRTFLRDYFNREIRANKFKPGADRVIARLHRHAQSRLSALHDAGDISDLYFDLRAGRDHMTNNNDYVHTDGTAFAKLRLLENVAGPGTCLVSNDETEIETFYHVDPPVDRHVPRAAPITAWQVPDGAMTLITNKFHGWQPVMHCEPPTPRGTARPLPRAVMVYDLSIRPRPVIS